LNIFTTPRGSSHENRANPAAPLGALFQGEFKSFRGPMHF